MKIKKKKLEKKLSLAQCTSGPHTSPKLHPEHAAHRTTQSPYCGNDEHTKWHKVWHEL